MRLFPYATHFVRSEAAQRQLNAQIPNTFSGNHHAFSYYFLQLLYHCRLCLCTHSHTHTDRILHTLCMRALFRSSYLDGSFMTQFHWCIAPVWHETPNIVFARPRVPSKLSFVVLFFPCCCIFFLFCVVFLFEKVFSQLRFIVTCTWTCKCLQRRHAQCVKK